jgi:hypothetical protein
MFGTVTNTVHMSGYLVMLRVSIRTDSCVARSNFSFLIPEDTRACMINPRLITNVSFGLCVTSPADGRGLVGNTPASYLEVPGSNLSLETGYAD